MDMRSPKIKFFRRSQGERVAYAVHGQGPVLVVPAWWVSHIELDWQVESYRQFFLALGEHFTVIRYDRPGAGLSDRDRSAFTLEDEVTTLRELILHLECGPCALFGVSCGGPTSIAYARSYPTQVTRIVFVDAYVKGADISNEGVQNALCSLVSAHWGLGAKTILDLFDPDMNPDTRKQLSAIHKQSASATMAEALLRLSYDMDASEEAVGLGVPSLVIHRTRDKTVPFDAGRNLAAILSDAQFVSIDGKAHLPWMGECASKVLAEITRFLGGVEDADELMSDLNRIRKSGNVWVLSYSGRTVHIKDSRGINDLARLIRHKHHDVHVMDLVSGGSSALQESTSEVLDEQALQQYKQRLQAIMEEKQQAGSSEDEASYLELEQEEEAILEALKQSVGLGGRSRQFDHQSEKARKAVASRIRVSLKHIEAVYPEMAEHFRKSIKTGNFCAYAPQPDLHWLTEPPKT